MTRIIKALILLLFFCVLTNNSSGQNTNDSTMYQVITIDGNTYFGQITEQDTFSIKLRTESVGEIILKRSFIQKITPINQESIKEGKLWMDNSQATRYFWSPNGYGLKAGEAYYQNVWVLFNQFAVGINDNISIGGGLVPLFLLAGAPTPVWLTPKISVPVVKDKLNVGGGALLGTVLGGDGTSYGIVYGISTVGSRDQNISLGLGYGYAGDSWAKSPMINVSTLLRVGPRGYFVSENYYFPSEDEDGILISMGGRSIFKGGAGLDYGLIMPIVKNMGYPFAFPWLGITVPF